LDFSVVIPARYDSQRLPGKALVQIAGKPMIQRVYEQASKSDARRIIVATDDERIASVVTSFGGLSRMTSAEHPSGTDRIQEVVRLESMRDDDIVVNVQGDEPLIPPEVINQVAGNLAENDVSMATLYETIDGLDELFDPNIVKLVSNEKGMAMYFSRAPIPWDRDHIPHSLQDSVPNEMDDRIQYKRHVGIYAYRVRLLNQYVTWPVDEIEQIERLEQLRILRKGLQIHVAEAVEKIPPGVDTEKDLQQTRLLLED